MTTTPAPGARTPAVRKARKPLEPVNPDVELQAYSHENGLGVLRIDGKRYAIGRIKDDAGRTIGMRLIRPLDPKEPDHDGDGLKRLAVDFTDPHGWSCSCEDATYRPDRPGGCRHVVALRQVAAGMKCAAPTT